MVNIIPLFWKWYYTQGAKDILSAWRNFILFALEYFSIPLLLKTLFSPWKRDITKKPRGLDLKRLFQYLAYNTISRGIGFFMRFLTICAGILFLFMVFVLGAIFFVLWIFLPLILIGLFILSLVLIF